METDGVSRKEYRRELRRLVDRSYGWEALPLAMWRGVVEAWCCLVEPIVLGVLIASAIVAAFYFAPLISTGVAIVAALLWTGIRAP